MDLATVLGFIGSVVIFIMGILTGGAGLSIYINVPSILVTVGGSLAGTIMSNPLSKFTSMPKYISKAINVPNFQEEKIISTLVNFSERARREGLLALEDDLEEVEDEFMRKGIQYVVDGTDPEIIKNLLYTELNQMNARHASCAKVLDDLSKLAPAYGMLGTLIGLIAMLINLSDPSSLGPQMAVALITTLYGSMIANMFCIPMKSKLDLRDADETLVKEIMIEGILSIQAGDNPRILEAKLVSFLSPDRRKTILSESGNE